jgi:hypothetical protein
VGFDHQQDRVAANKQFVSGLHNGCLGYFSHPSAILEL